MFHFFNPNLCNFKWLGVETCLSSASLVWITIWGFLVHIIHSSSTGTLRQLVTVCVPCLLDCHSWDCHLFIHHGSVYSMTFFIFICAPWSSLSLYVISWLAPLFCDILYDIVIATTCSWGIRVWCHVLYNTRLMWPLVRCISSHSRWTPSPQLGVLQLSPFWISPCSSPLECDPALRHPH